MGSPAALAHSLAVALRKESVDRNNHDLHKLLLRRLSLSARRAWIEIWCIHGAKILYIVALRKESVDRNNIAKILSVETVTVALRKESVDRNPTGYTQIG